MKLYVASDLHTEFRDLVLGIEDADVAILAGDIEVGVFTLDRIHSHFPDVPVIYVLGNHEFYRGNLNDIEQFKAAAHANVHVLEKDAVTIDGIRFLGTTLWTDFQLFGLAERPVAMMEAKERMPDFRIIRNGKRRFTPADSIHAHRLSCDWLEGQLATPFDGETVVVTHHAPSWLSVADRFKEDNLSPAFCSRLEHLMEQGGPCVWVHGHTHDAFDYEIYNTRLVCNPRGYPDEEGKYGFRPDLTIEV